MFQNLYFNVRGSQFRDHNFRSFPASRIERVSEAHVKWLLHGCPTTMMCAPSAKFGADNVHPEAQFEFDSIFESTLTPGACAGFFRSEPSVPATERDYYLSKAFQLLWLIAMECYGCRLKFDPNADVGSGLLETFLDSLPNDELLDLAHFDWESFRNELRAQSTSGAKGGDMIAALGDLHRFLPTATIGSGPADLVERGHLRGVPITPELARSLESAKKARGHSWNKAAMAMGLDLKTVRKVRSGDGFIDEPTMESIKSYVSAAKQKPA